MSTNQTRSGKALRLRVIWTDEVPKDANGAPTEFGLQSGRDVVLRGVRQPDGSTYHETEVTVSADTKGRVRVRGSCVQGRPDEPFLYLSWRVIGATAWLMRAKAMLTPITEEYVASLPDGATLETRVSRLGDRRPGHLQVWTRAEQRFAT